MDIFNIEIFFCDHQRPSVAVNIIQSMVTESLSGKGYASQLLPIIQAQTIVVSSSSLLKRCYSIRGEILLRWLIDVAIYRVLESSAS